MLSVFNPLRALILGAPEEPQLPEAGVPTVQEVRRVRVILSNRLPAELVDAVLDFAEYWPRQVVRCRPPVDAEHYVENNKLMLRTMPLGKRWHVKPEQKEHGWEAGELDESDPECGASLWPVLTKHPCRKIVFHLKSRDQGWYVQNRTFTKLSQSNLTSF